MKPRISIGLLWLLLIVPTGIFAQSADDLGLVLRVKGPCHASRFGIGEPAEFVCQKMDLEFQNNGSSPVVLINPTLGYGTGLKELIYYYVNFNLQTGKSKIIGEGRVSTVSSSKETDNLNAMSRLFDGERPPENFTITLQPKETFPFNDSLLIKVPVRTIEPEKTYQRLDPETGKSRKVVVPAKKLEPSCFRLVYEYSFLPHVPEPDFLENLNLKWKRYGRMPVGTNGTYTVTSELFGCVLD